MSTCISSHGEYGSHELDDTYVCARCGVLDEDALIAELQRHRADLAEAKDLLADLIVKSTAYGTQEGEFVALYIIATGPLHRAMPWLEQRGIVVRPGFDGRAARPAAFTPCLAKHESPHPIGSAIHCYRSKGHEDDHQGGGLSWTTTQLNTEGS